MPETKHSLRDLAHRIEEIGREHPAWSQAHELVLVMTGALRAMARASEINQDEARPLQVLGFRYINYREETTWRRVNPLSIRWGTSEWYKEPQWLLMCYDLGKKDRREFALSRMDTVVQEDRP
jgi:predicted DNA-binding transcriptional regulator YafY